MQTYGDLAEVFYLRTNWQKMLNVYWCNTRNILLNGNIRISGILAQISEVCLCAHRLRGAVQCVDTTWIFCRISWVRNSSKSECLFR